MTDSEQTPPNYDTEINADVLISDLVELAQTYAADRVEKRQWWEESLDYGDEWYEARIWMMEAQGGLRALSEAIAALQPETHSLVVDNYRNEDGTVDVRGYCRWLRECGQAAHERAGTPLDRNAQADEAETAYSRVNSIVRDDYCVGWPRLDDLGGNPLECDLP